jgi:hypothetical protein
VFSFRRPRLGARARLRSLKGLSRLFSSAKASEARGLRLLRNWLSSEQRAQFDARQYFEVIGCHSGKRYRIHYGQATNVQELDRSGKPIAGMCFVPIGYLVAGDVMLAQKIALETDELSALAVANRFNPSQPPPNIRPPF